MEHRVRERKREQKDKGWEDMYKETMQEGKKRINRKMEKKRYG